MTKLFTESQPISRRDFLRTTTAVGVAGTLLGGLSTMRAANTAGELNATPEDLHTTASPTLDAVAQHVQALGFRVERSAGDNPSLRRTTIPFIFPKFGDPGLAELSRRFDFASVVKDQDQFADLIALAKWVHDHIAREGRIPNVMDPIEILELSAANKGGFFCTHFSTVFPACAAAVGLPVRRIAIDSHLDQYDERKNTMHGTCDAYSTKFRKWFILDSMHGVYYLKNGIPLNAYELACEWRDNQGRDIRIVNLDGQQIAKSHKLVVPGWHESSSYHFFHARLMMDPYPNCGGGQAERVLFFQDEERRRNIWYNGNSVPKSARPGYKGEFMITDRLDDFYFDVNVVQMRTRAMEKKRALGVSFDTLTPNLAHFSYQVDGGAWQLFSGKRPWREEEARFYVSREWGAAQREEETRRNGGRSAGDDAAADLDEIQQNEVLWNIHPGSNTLAVKPINRFGRVGRVSRLEIEVG